MKKQSVSYTQRQADKLKTGTPVFYKSRYMKKPIRAVLLKVDRKSSWARYLIVSPQYEFEVEAHELYPFVGENKFNAMLLKVGDYNATIKSNNGIVSITVGCQKIKAQHVLKIAAFINKHTKHSKNGKRKSSTKQKRS